MSVKRWRRWYSDSDTANLDSRTFTIRLRNDTRVSGKYNQNFEQEVVRASQRHQDSQARLEVKATFRERTILVTGEMVLAEFAAYYADKGNYFRQSVVQAIRAIQRDPKSVWLSSLASYLGGLWSVMGVVWTSRGA